MADSCAKGTLATESGMARTEAMPSADWQGGSKNLLLHWLVTTQGVGTFPLSSCVVVWWDPAVT